MPVRMDKGRLQLVLVINNLLQLLGDKIKTHIWRRGKEIRSATRYLACSLVVLVSHAAFPGIQRAKPLLYGTRRQFPVIERGFGSYSLSTAPDQYMLFR